MTRCACLILSLFSVLSAQALAASSPACAGPFTPLAGSAQGGGVTTSTATTRCQRVRFDNQGTPVVMWGDSSTGAPEVYLRQWSGQAWVGLAGSDVDGGLSRHSGVTDGSGYRSCPGHVVFDSQNRPYAAWMNYDGNNQAIYLRRFNNGVWEQLNGSGSGNGFSNGSADYWPSMSIDALDRVAVTWTRGAELVALRWNGTAWAQLAGSATSPGIAGSTANVFVHNSTLGSNGDVYAVWSDYRRGFANSEIRLLQWNGTAWAGVGLSNADGGIARGDRPSVVDDGTGRPFVGWEMSYSDGGSSIEAVRWNGSSWVRFPSPTSAGANGGSAIDRNGEIFVTYEERISTGTAVRLVHWTGTAWENCPLGFPDTGGSTWPAVALGPNGEIAVSWSEEVSPGDYQGYVLANLLPDAGPAGDAGSDGGDAGPANDAGAENDAGTSMDGGGGSPGAKFLPVGCGCSLSNTSPAVLGGLAVLAGLLWAGRLWRRRSSPR